MLLSTQTTLLLLLAGLSSAAVLPQDAPRRDGLVARNTPASPAPTQTQSAQGQGQGLGPVQPAAVTPSVSLPVACDYTYCDGSSSWCFYWGGVTSYDPNHGPVPGETRTNLGPCGAAATTAPAATR